MFTATSAASLTTTCSASVFVIEPMDPGPGYVEFSDVRGAAAFTLSCITNLWATGLIIYKTW